MTSYHIGNRQVTLDKIQTASLRKILKSAEETYVLRATSASFGYDSDIERQLAEYKIDEIKAEFARRKA